MKLDSSKIRAAFILSYAYPIIWISHQCSAIKSAVKRFVYGDDRKFYCVECGCEISKHRAQYSLFCKEHGRWK